MTIAQKKIYDFLKANGDSAYYIICQKALALSDEEMQKAVDALIDENIIEKDTYIQPTIRIV